IEDLLQSNISQGKLCGRELSKKDTVLNMNNVSYGMVINQVRIPNEITLYLYNPSVYFQRSPRRQWFTISW
ncbi:MAG: hypothetical protein KAX05_12645, partial [Bacteroidales bacterium]|nr:hypothetical protein [Bacteroidales bacterium]